MIQEVKRVLKPNGKILITTPFVWDEHEAPHDYCRYSSFGLKDIFERNGFRIIKQTKNGSFSELIIQLILIYLNRNFAKKKLLKYPFFLIVCPILNLTSNLVVLLSSSIVEENTIYLGHTLLAEKKD